MILKSDKAIFILRLMLLLPLSLLTGFLGVMGTGGGHGNYFPFILVSGPASILFAVPLHGLDEGIYFFGGIVCLYGTYAFLLKFIKSDTTFRAILIFHIVSASIAMLFLGNNGYPMFVKEKIDVVLALLGVNAITFALLSLIFWLLKLIHKSHST